MYKEIQIAQNEICTNCRKNKELETPLSLYHVGENMYNELDTILFVGKTAVGGANFETEYKGGYSNNNITDATKFGYASLNLKEKYATSRPFYSYTNQIIKDYYGSVEDGLKKIALSNLIKCNNASTEDETSNDTKENCINKLGVIWKEIELIKPRRVVFFTHNYYDNYIENYVPNNLISIDELTNKSHCVKIGNKIMPWWHKKLNLNGGKTQHILRIGHPQMKNREDYVNSVVNWLHQTKLD